MQFQNKLKSGPSLWCANWFGRKGRESLLENLFLGCIFQVLPHHVLCIVFKTKEVFPSTWHNTPKECNQCVALKHRCTLKGVDDDGNSVPVLWLRAMQRFLWKLHKQSSSLVGSTLGKVSCPLEGSRAASLMLSEFEGFCYQYLGMCTHTHVYKELQQHLDAAFCSGTEALSMCLAMYGDGNKWWSLLEALRPWHQPQKNEQSFGQVVQWGL